MRSISRVRTYRRSIPADRIVGLESLIVQGVANEPGATTGGGAGTGLSARLTALEGLLPLPPATLAAMGAGLVASVVVPDRAAFTTLRAMVAALPATHVGLEVTILSDEGDLDVPGRMNRYFLTKTKALKYAFVLDDDEVAGLGGAGGNGPGNGGLTGTQPVVWEAVTLAAAGAGQLLVAQPIAHTPIAPPIVLYPLWMTVGTLDSELYWSGDGGVTARPAVNGQFIPQAGDRLYANAASDPAHPGWLGFTVPANDPILILYFHN
jgi:hypothetical protein